MVDDASQTSDGVGASPLTSLEEEQMLPANLRAELAAQGHQIADLKTKLDREKLLNQQLKNNVSHLQSDNAAHIEISTAANLRIKELETKVKQRDTKLRELEDESVDRAEEIKSLCGILRVSLYLCSIVAC